MFRRILATTGLFLIALSNPVRCAQAQVVKIEPLQAQFDKETDPVRKARLLTRLGDAQFAESHGAQERNDFAVVGLLMEKYRDNVRVCLAALEEKLPDAEKYDTGYRLLEVYVRHTLKDLDETILSAPPEYRPPLTLVRQDLEDLHEEMLRCLFPRRPGDKPVGKPVATPDAKPIVKPGAKQGAPPKPN